LFNTLEISILSDRCNFYFRIIGRDYIIENNQTQKNWYMAFESITDAKVEELLSLPKRITNANTRAKMKELF